MVGLSGILQQFSYKQLSLATGAFKEEFKLGQGGFGSVYLGVLPTSGLQVAVKKITDNSSRGEKEFMAEVSIISQLRHKNLIQTLGWCKDASKGQYFIVYELMPHGSLDKALFSSDPSQAACLSWKQRLNIVSGVAAALEYLHQGSKLQIIHRDVKSSNIMLDKDWDSKLGDFGLARSKDHLREAASTLMGGTYGYIAPEVAASGTFTEKTNVLSFGAVVLEVVCGRRALQSDVPEDKMILVNWVWQEFSEGKLLGTVDKRLKDYDEHWMELMLSIGLLCSHPNPLNRPSMRQVVEILSGNVPVPSITDAKPGHLSSGYRTDFTLPSRNLADNR
jgi:serine/threonine protein kinase